MENAVYAWNQVICSKAICFRRLCIGWLEAAQTHLTLIRYIPGVMFEAVVGGPVRKVAMDAVFIGPFGDRSAQDSMMHLIGRKAPPGFTFPLIEGTEKRQTVE